MTRYAIGLGSNMGDRLEHLTGAVEEIAAIVDHYTVASLYETQPVGGPDQDPFLNTVMLVETDLGPLAILDALQRIEAEHGRERKVRWGPRTLDLDLITSDGPPYHDDRLSLPHPRAGEREFVLRPLVDVWPEGSVTPRLSAADALERVGDQGVDRLSDDWVPPVATWKPNLLLAGQFFIVVAVAIALAYDGTLPDGEITPLRALGGLTAFVGMILAFIASRRLGPAMRASPVPRPEGDLITGGPYRLVRHPIYGGLSLFLMGTALVLESLVGLLVAAALVPYFMLKAGYEERQLRMRYAGYSAYRRAVPRRLIPFVI